MDQVMEASAPVVDLPLAASLRAQLLEAAILAGAWVASSRLHGHPAARMCLMTELRRCGLVATPPTVDVRARFDLWLRQLADPRRARRLISRQMDAFVGTPWAATVMRIADAVARSSGDPLDARSGAAINALRLGLGLCWPTDCR
jgi:hypothetical protein